VGFVLNSRSQAVQTDSILIEELDCSRTGLSSKLPLVFHPTFDKEECNLSIIVPALGIDVFAKTRAELVTELEEVLPVLWDEYAKADSVLLTSSAQKIKTVLLQTFSETTLA
jgi:hypothetical protein